MTTLYFLIYFYGFYGLGLLQVSAFDCSYGNLDGLYCIEDLSGYVDCNQNNKITKCPKNTRCTCFTNTKCQKWYGHEICQPLDEAPLLPVNFQTTYEEKISVYSSHEDFTQSLLKTVVQDFTNQRLYTQSVDTYTKQHKFTVIKLIDSKLTQFVGIYPDSNGKGRDCYNSTIYSFPNFFPEFTRFVLTKSSNSVEEWTDKISSRHSGEPDKLSKWIFNVDSTNQMYSPRVYDYKYYGSADDQYDYFTNWKFTKFEEYTATDASFEIPEFCK